MTMREKIINMLIERGMFDSQAEEVFARVKEFSTEMQGRWDDETADYPEPLITILWLTVKHIAKEYIEEKCPQAWFRPVFEDELTKPERQKVLARIIDEHGRREVWMDLEEK